MTDHRKGDWMQTFTGRQFWPLDPRPEEIHLADIAHALSMLCRYGGHCQKFYSVAEHSVLLSHAVPAEHALWALLHDAAEAYIVDVPRPLKKHLAGYEEAEARVMAAVCQRFGLHPDMPPEVKAADHAIIGDERFNLSICDMPWTTRHDGVGAVIRCQKPEDAEKSFLLRAIQLGIMP